MKKTLLGLIFFCSLFFCIPAVRANTINKIDMDIYIDSNGNAKITEVWDAYLVEGTEGYRSYTNLGDSSISNFSVSDDSGKVYDVLSYWDTDDSFDNKAYKGGMTYVNDKVELCWGISNYGNRTYILKYDINHFVTQYTDTQGIYFNLLNLEQPVGSAKITIHSDIPFSLENAKIWGFGYKGFNVFEDGSIVLDSNGLLAQNQYMVSLIRFESNLFHVIKPVDHTFDSVYISAFNDVNKLDDLSVNNDYRMQDIVLLIIMIPISLLFSPFIIFIVLMLLSKSRRNDIFNSNQLHFGKDGRVLPNDKQINYYREIPCNKDLERAYWMCLQYNIVSESMLKQGLIGAILLKWIRNDYIIVSKKKKSLFNFKDNNYIIDFNRMTHADNEIENDLFNMLISASGDHRILEAKEFSTWSRKNYYKINSWFSNIDRKMQEDLEKQGFITKIEEQISGMFWQKRTVVVKHVNSQLKNEAIQLKGFKKFLLDFSMISKREFFEVHIWEDYLIFAHLLGIADKVEKQFRELYPDFNQKTVLDTEMTTIAIRNMSKMCYNSVWVATMNSSYSGLGRSSGGGGRSYSSGGSSSRGSSGGGFR